MNDQLPTVGKRLKQAREEQNLSISEISIKTRIKEKYLEAIEADRLNMLPSPIQQKGFIRAFAQAVGLDPREALNLLPGEKEIEKDPDIEIKGGDSSPEIDSDPGAGQVPGSSDRLDFGDSLVRQRERLGLSPSDVEEEIFIPIRYLEILENSQLEGLPSPVQGRGMLKNYAQFLGLDPDPLLDQFASVLQKKHQIEVNDQSDSKSKIQIPGQVRRLLSGPGLVSALIFILVGSALTGSFFLVFGRSGGNQLPTPTIPGVADVLLPSQTATPSLTPVPVEDGISIDITASPEAGESENLENPTPTIAVLDSTNVQIQIIVLQRSFVRVTVDDEIVFEGRLQPGNVEVFEAERSIEILTGNAGGIEVIYNQRDLGALGLFGEVVNRVFTSEGIATPTPTVTPTPTITETPTPTQTPSPTLVVEE
jgi:cytoskeletal protein RodZ